MQRIIDIIFELCKAYMDQLLLDAKVIPSGTIIMWKGTFEDIPDGWVRCDGDNGTPDLRGLFVRSAGAGIADHDTGGTSSHTHAGDSDHSHPIGPGSSIAAGTNYDNVTDPPKKIGSTGTAGTIPVFYAVRYIMKL